MGKNREPMECNEAERGWYRSASLLWVPDQVRDDKGNPKGITSSPGN